MSGFALMYPERRPGTYEPKTLFDTPCDSWPRRSANTTPHAAIRASSRGMPRPTYASVMKSSSLTGSTSTRWAAGAVVVAMIPPQPRTARARGPRASRQSTESEGPPDGPAGLRGCGGQERFGQRSASSSPEPSASTSARLASVASPPAPDPPSGERNGLNSPAGLGRLVAAEQRRQFGGLARSRQRGRIGPVLEERVVLVARKRLERLAGEGLEGRPPLALAGRGDVLRRAAPGRDQLADDHVLLEADQVVLGAVDGGLGEHPGRLLEGRGGEERRRVQRRLGDAEQDRLRRRGLAALGEDAVVDLLEVEAIDELGRQQLAVARLVDADLAEHLADDDLDVLVVDRDALAPVDLLDFLDQVALDGVLAPGVEVLLRVDRAVRDRVTGADLLAVLDLELGVVRDRVLALDDVLGTDHEAVVVADEEALDGRDDVGRR